MNVATQTTPSVHQRRASWGGAGGPPGGVAVGWEEVGGTAPFYPDAGAPTLGTAGSGASAVTIL
jgi:hypothetical protein